MSSPPDSSFPWLKHYDAHVPAHLEYPRIPLYYSRLSDFLPFPLNLFQGVQEMRLLNKALGFSLVDCRALLRDDLPADFRPAPVGAQEPAILIYSGGTTGAAKGVVLSHFGCVANAHQAIAWGNLTRQDRILAVLPFFHGFGMSITLNTPILVGGEIIAIPRFKARDVVKAIQKYRPTFFIGVPTMFVAFNNLPAIERCDLSSLKGIFVGAAPLTRAIKDQFEARTGGRMIEGYGWVEFDTFVRHAVPVIAVVGNDAELVADRS